ncbi:MAG: hypothetical protein NT103_02465 [Campylobacterales bacterium]|nr:hypothetical protein [Campylobacterales bacterium]
MKKLAFLMMMGMMSLVWGSEEVTVQVINAVYEKSITHAFDAKLKKTGLDIHKKIENGRYVVTLGAYPAEKSAKPALKKARLVVTKDAFIRPVNRDHTAVAHNCSIQPIAHTNTQEHPAVVAVAETPKEVEVAKHEAPVALVIVQEVKQPAAVAAAMPECDKKELRKDAFAEAINYYKTSPYYRFEPVVLRQ